MLLIAFLGFALLMVGMMMAPTGATKSEPVSVPTLRIGEASA